MSAVPSAAAAALPVTRVVFNDVCPICSRSVGGGLVTAVRLARGVTPDSPARLSFVVHQSCAGEASGQAHRTRLDALIARALRSDAGRDELHVQAELEAEFGHDDVDELDSPIFRSL